MNEVWLTASHGIYPFRPYYDEGPLGDNWCYLDTHTLCIMSFRPEGEERAPRTKGVIVSGPFPTLEAAKAAYVVLFGSGP